MAKKSVSTVQFLYVREYASMQIFVLSVECINAFGYFEERRHIIYLFE